MSQIQVGETLGSFRIESILGSGAMGVVYRATNEKTNRVAAVKVLGGDVAPPTGTSKLPARFEREAKILEHFRHPGIVRYLARGRFRGILYFAMEYVDGETLERVIKERGPLPWREVVELGIQICDALHYAHERGVVHRDLKPSNLMITGDGKVKLTDFGIAKDLDGTALTATGRTLGTAAYMAPEQIKGTPAISHKTDLYALGIVLYQLLTARMPFEGNTPVVLMHCHLNEPPPRPSARVAEIPKVLDELVVTLMAKNPPDRPWDAAAVGHTLTKLRDKAERGASIAMVWPNSRPGARKPSQSGDGAAGGPESLEGPRKKSQKGRSIAALAPSAIFGWTGSSTRSPGASGARSSGGSATRSAGDSGLRSLRISRTMIETTLLVAALLAIGGFIVYWLYPPSADYLYHQADQLMASSSRSDWLTARDDYIEPLDRRFPNHPYREQTRKWRDKIMLNDAEGRAAVLSSPVKLRDVNQPANNVERQFVLTYNLVTEASQRGDDLRAKQFWDELARSLKSDDPEQRPWYLLAQERIKALDMAIQDRRRYVEKQLELIMSARVGRREREATIIWSKLVEQYGHFTDLADVFGQPQAARTPETLPTPTPGSSSGPTEEGKTSGAATERRDDLPKDAGNSDHQSQPHSQDDQPSPKPATGQPKSEPGVAHEQTTSLDPSNASPPISVVND